MQNKKPWIKFFTIFMGCYHSLTVQPDNVYKQDALEKNTVIRSASLTPSPRGEGRTSLVVSISGGANTTLCSFVTERLESQLLNVPVQKGAEITLCVEGKNDVDVVFYEEEDLPEEFQGEESEKESEREGEKENDEAAQSEGEDTAEEGEEEGQPGATHSQKRKGREEGESKKARVDEGTKGTDPVGKRSLVQLTYSVNGGERRQELLNMRDKSHPVLGPVLKALVGKRSGDVFVVEGEEVFSIEITRVIGRITAKKENLLQQ